MAKITIKRNENNNLTSTTPILTLKESKHVRRGNKFKYLFFGSLSINLLLILYFLTTYIR